MLHKCFCFSSLLPRPPYSANRPAHLYARTSSPCKRIVFSLQLDALLSSKGVSIDKVINLKIDDTLLVRRVLGRCEEEAVFGPTCSRSFYCRPPLFKKWFCLCRLSGACSFSRLPSSSHTKPSVTAGFLFHFLVLFALPMGRAKSTPTGYLLYSSENSDLRRQLFTFIHTAPLPTLFFFCSTALATLFYCQFSCDPRTAPTLLRGQPSTSLAPWVAGGSTRNQGVAITPSSAHRERWGRTM